MRGIRRELAGDELARAEAAQARPEGPTDPSTYLDEEPERSRRQLHNSAIRNTWDRHYVGLDRKLDALGLKPGDQGYDSAVRQYLMDAREEVDHTLGRFFSESQSDYVWTPPGPQAPPSTS